MINGIEMGDIDSTMPSYLPILSHAFLANITRIIYKITSTEHIICALVYVILYSYDRS